MKKRLYRSRTNKVLAGVCGGFGDYFDIDPVLIRLLYLLLTVFTAGFPGVLVYIICFFVIPEAPLITPSTSTASEAPKTETSHDAPTV